MLYGSVMLLSVISLIVIDEGPFKALSDHKAENTSKEEVDDTILRIKSPINYNDDGLVASHLCSKSEGHLLDSHKTESYKTNSQPEEGCSTRHINSTISNHNVHCDKNFPQNVLQMGNLTDDQEGNLTNIRPNKTQLETASIEKIENCFTKNPVVKMFTLIEWSLMKSPYFLITMVGSSCSFSAILNYFLLLPLLCKEFGLSEDKTSILLSATNASDVLFRLVFAWAGDWKCSKELFCGKPRRILYAISVFGLSIFMIGAFNVLLRRSLFSKINDVYLKTIVLTKLYVFRHYICKHFSKLIVLLYSIWNICERNTWERAISVHRII